MEYKSNVGNNLLWIPSVALFLLLFSWLEQPKFKTSDALLKKPNTPLYDVQQDLKEISEVGGELQVKQKNAYIFAAIGKAFSLENTFYTSTKKGADKINCIRMVKQKKTDR